MKNEIKFLSENLYKFRKEKGISQEELANKINVSRQAVYKWETGERIPDITNLNALCMEFDKNIEDFIEGAEYLVKNDSEDSIKDSKEPSENKEKNKKIKNTLKILVIIIFVIFLLTVIIKAAFFSIMFAKVDKYKGSNNYRYQTRKGIDSLSVDDNYIVQYKDGVQYIYDLNNDDTMTEIWSYYKTANEKFSYRIEIRDMYKETEEWKYNYYYIEGFNYYKEDSPYELVSKIVKENYNIINVLNPFYILKFDLKNKDLIFEEYDKEPRMANQVYIKNIFYIDLETGLLSKKEEYELDKLISYSVYFDYEFDKINNSLELSEETKKQIIEGAKRREEELLKQEELLNKEN